MSTQRQSITDEILVDTIHRRQKRPTVFWARVLAEYKRKLGIDDAGLVAELGIALTDLPSLALCRWPETANPKFEADLRRAARRSRVEPEKL